MAPRQIEIIYGVILLYFLLGVNSTRKINRFRSPDESRASWLKFGVYFAILLTVTTLILFAKGLFLPFSMLIMVIGSWEVFRIFPRKKELLTASALAATILLFLTASAGIILLALQEQPLILFTFLVVSTFDAVSQNMGQRHGKIHLVRTISPNKTLEGLAGGMAFSLITSVLLKNILSVDLAQSLLLGFGVSIFAFLGDLAASGYKRYCGVKDFSRIIPGHGGVLDRFDSLLGGSLFISVLVLIHLL